MSAQALVGNPRVLTLMVDTRPTTHLLCLPRTYDGQTYLEQCKLVDFSFDKILITSQLRLPYLWYAC